MKDLHKDATTQPKDKPIAPKMDEFGKPMTKPAETLGAPKMAAPKDTTATARETVGANVTQKPAETVTKTAETVVKPIVDAAKDSLAGRWAELKGPAREKWAKLTEADFTRLSGKTEELSAILQQRYSYAAGVAEKEIADFLRAHPKA